MLASSALQTQTISVIASLTVPILAPTQQLTMTQVQVNGRIEYRWTEVES